MRTTGGGLDGSTEDPRCRPRQASAPRAGTRAQVTRDGRDGPAQSHDHSSLGGDGLVARPRARPARQPDRGVNDGAVPARNCRVPRSRRRVTTPLGRIPPLKRVKKPHRSLGWPCARGGLGAPLGPAARRGLQVGLEGQEAVPEAEALARGYPPAIYGGHGALARRPGRASDVH